MRRALPLLILLASCAGERDGGGTSVPDAGRGQPVASGERDAAPSTTDAAESDAIPRFATSFHLDFAHIERISRFRAGVGHDYSDSYERCRAMKHYICPIPCPGSGAPPAAVAPPPWTELEVRSPVTGTVLRLDPERS